MIKLTKLIGIPLVLVVIMTTPNTSLAEEKRTLEEIVVTAQKRESTLQKTSLAISAHVTLVGVTGSRQIYITEQHLQYQACSVANARTGHMVLATASAQVAHPVQADQVHIA